MEKVGKWRAPWVLSNPAHLFTDRAAEAQRGLATCPRTHSFAVTALGLEQPLPSSLAFREQPEAPHFRNNNPIFPITPPQKPSPPSSSKPQMKGLNLSSSFYKNELYYTNKLIGMRAAGISHNHQGRSQCLLFSLTLTHTHTRVHHSF